MTRLVSQIPKPSEAGWEPAVAPFDGAYFAFRMVRASDCQRHPVADIVENRVKRLSSHFEVGKMLHFTVSERDGVKRIVDGNHRWTVLKARGLLATRIQAVVYRGLTFEGERLMWEILEDKMKKRPIEFLISRALRGVEPDKTIHDTFFQRGLNIRRVTAIAPIKDAFAETSQAALSLAVWTMKCACPLTGKVEGHVIHALALLSEKYGSALDYKRLGRAVQEAEPKKLSENGRAESRRSHYAHTSAQFIAQKLLYAYNRNMRTNRLPEWELS